MNFYKNSIYFFIGYIATLSLEAQPKVIVFYSVDCPMCIRSTLTIRMLQKTYKNINLDFIFSNTGTTEPQIEEFKQKYLLTNANFILDSNQYFQKKYKAKVTPEVFLINDKNQIIYTGAIDNSLTANQQKKILVTKKYLANALHQFINKKPIEIAKTKAFGCLIE